MTEAWQNQLERWRLLERWELGRLRFSSTDYRRALEWMTDAWELASRVNPGWGSKEEADRHWRQLAEIQRSLAKAFPRS
jgi:hypothetical protein